MPTHKGPRGLAYFEEKLKSGGYTKISDFNRATYHMQVTKTERNYLQKLAEVHFGKKALAAKPGGKKMTRTRRGGKGDVNGAGEALSLTMVRVMVAPDIRETVMRLLAKAIDDGKTLPVLHEEMQALGKVLP